MRKRLLFGSLLAAAALLVVGVDAWFAPWYPCLLVIFLAVSHLLCAELLALLPAAIRPRSWLCHTGMAALVLAGWAAHAPPFAPYKVPYWYWILGTFIGYVLSVFLTEMACYRGSGAGSAGEPAALAAGSATEATRQLTQPVRQETQGTVVIRLALAVWVVAYLGLTSSFLGQLRWLDERPVYGTTALLLAIFVPKFCDIGAYFSGRYLGRNRMSPLLSPKKTWEGAIGGLALAVIGTVLIDQIGYLISGVALLQRLWWAEVAFGLSVGLAGMMGDLAESLIKRDCGQKDAGQAVPGFGGILDVVDAVIFAAPVAYLWLWGLPRFLSPGPVP